MGNATSQLIETAIASSASSDVNETALSGGQKDTSKLVLYRLLHEKMDDVTEKEPPSHAMMAPKKKFLIGYRGDEGAEPVEKKVDTVEVVTAMTSMTSPMMSMADTSRSRSNTVSLPFRCRGTTEVATRREYSRPVVTNPTRPTDAVAGRLVEPARDFGWPVEVTRMLESERMTTDLVGPSRPVEVPPRCQVNLLADPTTHMLVASRPATASSRQAAETTHRLVDSSRLVEPTRLMEGPVRQVDTRMLEASRLAEASRTVQNSSSRQVGDGGQRSSVDSTSTIKSCIMTAIDSRVGVTTATHLPPVVGRPETVSYYDSVVLETGKPPPPSSAVYFDRRHLNQYGTVSSRTSGYAFQTDRRTAHDNTALVPVRQVDIAGRQADQLPGLIEVPTGRLVTAANSGRIVDVRCMEPQTGGPVDSSRRYEMFTGHAGTMADQRGFVPDQRGAVVSQRSQVDHHVGMVDHRAGFVDQPRGGIPDQRAGVTDPRAVIVDPRGGLVDQRGGTADQKGGHTLDRRAVMMMPSGMDRRQMMSVADYWKDSDERRRGSVHDTSYNYPISSTSAGQYITEQRHSTSAVYGRAMAPSGDCVPYQSSHAMPVVATGRGSWTSSVQRQMIDSCSQSATSNYSPSQAQSSQASPSHAAGLRRNVNYNGPVVVSDMDHRSSQQDRSVRIEYRAGSLQPVEPSVRPRIAGLTYAGTPYDNQPPPASQSELARYSVATPRYDPVESYVTAPRLTSSEHKASPYYPAAARHARTDTAYPAGVAETRVEHGGGGGGGSDPYTGVGETVVQPGGQCGAPLDLTVRKEKPMTAEAFLRRCHGEQSQPFHPSHYNDDLSTGADLRRSAAVGMMMLTDESYPGQSTRSRMQETAADAGRRHVESSQHHGPQSRDDVDNVMMTSPAARRSARWEQHQCVASAAGTNYPPSAAPGTSVGGVARHPVHGMPCDDRYSMPTAVTYSEVMSDTAASRGRSSEEAWLGDHSRPMTSSDVGDSSLRYENLQRNRLGRTSVAMETMTSSSVFDRPSQSMPHSDPTPPGAASRRVPMVQLLGGKYSPSDILHLGCKVCGSTYGSLRSFRLHFAKAHGMEPSPEHFSIQTISDARSQAQALMQAQRGLQAHGSTRDSPPTLQIEPSVDALRVNTAGLPTLDVEQHNRPSSDFAAAVSPAPLVKPRSVAEVYPIKKITTMTSAAELHQGAQKKLTSSNVEQPHIVATKRLATEAGEEEVRRLKCKKCGEFSTQHLSALRQHLRSHEGASVDPSGGSNHMGGSEQWTCAGCGPAATDTVGGPVQDSDAVCTVCLEGFNDVSDWQHHVTSQHMMRSCICKSCDLGFTNAGGLRRHLSASHGIQSPTGSAVDLEYRCLFCPEAFSNEDELYRHTRTHEQQYSSQQQQQDGGRGGGRGLRTDEPARVASCEVVVQTAVPDTTCPEDQQRTTSRDCLHRDVTSAAGRDDLGGRDDIVELGSSMTSPLEMHIAQNVDRTVTMSQRQQSADCRPNSKKASILRRLSADCGELTVGHHQPTTVPTHSQLAGSYRQHYHQQQQQQPSSRCDNSADNVGGGGAYSDKDSNQHRATGVGASSGVMFGDLLSSMHREVENTLRQMSADDDVTPMTSRHSAPVTSSVTSHAVGGPGGSTSACVRDVCDAIIVQALKQHQCAGSSELQQSSLAPVSQHGTSQQTLWHCVDSMASKSQSEADLGSGYSDTVCSRYEQGSEAGSDLSDTNLLQTGPTQQFSGDYAPSDVGGCPCPSDSTFPKSQSVTDEHSVGHSHDSLHAKSNFSETQVNVELAGYSQSQPPTHSQAQSSSHLKSQSSVNQQDSADVAVSNSSNKSHFSHNQLELGKASDSSTEAVVDDVKLSRNSSPEGVVGGEVDQSTVSSDVLDLDDPQPPLCIDLNRCSSVSPTHTH